MAFTTWSTTDLVNITLSGGNLIATVSVGNAGVRGKDPKRSGKFYIEYTVPTAQNTSNIFGLASRRATLGSLNSPASAGPQFATGVLVFYDVFGVQLTSMPSIGSLSGAVVCCAVDLDARLVWFRVGAAGNWNANAANNPATGVGGVSIATVGLGQGIDAYPWVFMGNVGNSVTANFGASAFTGAVPSGYTSGWDDSVAAVSYMVPTQLGTETWLTTNPAMQLTQIGIETWVPANAYTVDSYSGLIREALLATDGRANVSGLVREVLRTTGSSGVTFAAMSGLVRETLLGTGGGAVTTQQARAIILA